MQTISHAARLLVRRLFATHSLPRPTRDIWRHKLIIFWRTFATAFARSGQMTKGEPLRGCDRARIQTIILKELGVKVVFRALQIMASLAVAITALFIAVPSILLRPALAHWQAGGFPSLSAAVGNSCGVLWSSATGAADLRSERPARATDLYGIGSITKTFVAVVTLQLVDDGRLDLERPVTDYVPRLRDMHIANVGTATLAQLMEPHVRHSKLGGRSSLDTRCPRRRYRPNRRWQPADSLAYIHGKPALSPPGTEYHYANTNYTLLGLAIEAVTGQPLASEIRRRILAPLELHDTYLEGFQSEPVDHLPRRYHFDTEMFRTMGWHCASFTTARPGLLDVSTSSLAPEWAAGEWL